ncbi:MAG: hypothetical protein ACYDCO_23650 [Armatimonadota bacterium]
MGRKQQSDGAAMLAEAGQGSSVEVLDGAEPGRQRDLTAHWLAGWGAFFLIIGTLAGVGVIVYALMVNKPIWLVAGVAIFIAVGWMRAWCNWASELLLTLGRIEHKLDG